MAALVWDEQSQAWMESETPLVYDSASGAFAETSGMVRDTEAQAWTEVWGQKNQILYSASNGINELGNISRILGIAEYSCNINSSGIYYNQTNIQGQNWYGFATPIDVTPYAILKFKCSHITFGGSNYDATRMGICTSLQLSDEQFQSSPMILVSRWSTSETIYNQEFDLDISPYSGLYYVMISSYHYISGNVTDIILEK